MLALLLLSLVVPFATSNDLARPRSFLRASFASRTNRTALGADVRPERRIQLHQVADAMLDVYQALVSMRYIHPEGIEPGPHDINTTLCKEQGIDDSIIYLFQILPYIHNEYAESTGFVYGSTFADFRREEDILTSRDPMYAGPDESDDQPDWDGRLNLPYMEPTMTTLSNLGNHQCVLIYDVITDRMWVADQMGGSCDPPLKGVPSSPRHGNNRNSFTHEPSRPATEVLRGLVQRYRDLLDIPGGDADYGVPWWDYEGFKLIYQQHGWPDAFDGEAFDASLARFQAREQAKYLLDEPLRLKERAKNWDDSSDWALAGARWRFAQHVSLEDRWLAELEFLVLSIRFDDMDRSRQRDLEQAERECPNNECQEHGNVLFEEIMQLEGQLKNAWEDKFLSRRRRLARTRLLYRAWKEADDEANTRFPDRYFQFLQKWEDPDPSMRHRDLEDIATLKHIKARVTEMEGLVNRIPQEASKAIIEAESEMERWHSNVWRIQERLQAQHRFRLQWWTNSKLREELTTCRVVNDKDAS